MQPISYARHRFPPDIIRRAVWLYLRFTLSYRDVEDLLAERGLMVSNEIDPSLGSQIRAHNRQELTGDPAESPQSMASRRDGDLNRWTANVYVARRRQ